MNFIENKNELTVEEKMDLMINYNYDHDILLNKIDNILKKINNNDNININYINVDKNVYQDLDIFGEVFKKINHTQTLFGEYLLKTQLKNVSTDVSLLKKNQKYVYNLISNSEKCLEIQKKLNHIKGLEKQIVWFWNEVTEDTQSIYDMVFINIFNFNQNPHSYFNFLPFKFLSNFVNNQYCLNLCNIYKIWLSPTVTICTPIVSIIIPYILLWFSGINISFWQYFKMTTGQVGFILKLIPQLSKYSQYISVFITGLWTFFYFQSVYYGIKNSINTVKIINILHRKINVIYQFITNSYDIIKIYLSCNNNYNLDENINNLKYQCEEFISMFSNFSKNVNLLSNKGLILSVYRKFLNMKDQIIPILYKIGEIDMRLSIGYLVCHHGLTFTKFVNNEKPYIDMKNISHPGISINKNNINSKNIVKNSIKLGGNNNMSNMLITGPNRAGKSTFIKTVALNILLSQTLGISSSDYCHLTPFHIINTYLHVPDEVGHKSLFEAEMFRAKEHIDMLKNMKYNKKAFIIMDEIFTSTNFVEGFSAAYAICKKLVEFENSCSLITTHYTGLKDLEKECNGKIKNYQFLIETSKYQDQDGINRKIIKYPYIMTSGYSNEYIALDIIDESGFDEDILDNARKMAEKIKKYQMR